MASVIVSDSWRSLGAVDTRPLLLLTCNPDIRRPVSDCLTATRSQQLVACSTWGGNACSIARGNCLSFQYCSFHVAGFSHMYINSGWTPEAVFPAFSGASFRILARQANWSNRAGLPEASWHAHSTWHLNPAVHFDVSGECLRCTVGSRPRKIYGNCREDLLPFTGIVHCRFCRH